MTSPETAASNARYDGLNPALSILRTLDRLEGRATAEPLSEVEWTSRWLRDKADWYSRGALLQRDRGDTDAATILEVICDHLRELSAEIKTSRSAL